MWGWGASTQERKAMDFCNLMTQGSEWSELKEFCNQSASASSDFMPVRTLKQMSDFLNRTVVGTDCKIKIKRGGYDKQANTACVFCTFDTSRMETHWTLVFRFDRKTETIESSSIHCTSCEKEKREKMFDSAYETLLSSTSIVSKTSMQKLGGSRVTSRRVSQIVDAPRMSPSFFKVLNGYAEYKKGCTSGHPCLCKQWSSNISYDDDDQEDETETPPPAAPARISRIRTFSAKERKRLSTEGMKLLRRISRTMDDEEPPSFSSYTDEKPPSFSEDPPSFSASMSVGDAFRRSSMTKKKKKKSAAPPPPRGRKPSNAPPAPRRKPSNAPPAPRRKPSNAPPAPRRRKPSNAPAPPRRKPSNALPTRSPRKKSLPAQPRRKSSNERHPKKSSPARPPIRRNNNKTPPSFSTSSRRSDTPPSFSDEPPSFGASSPSPPSFTSTSRRKKSAAPTPPRRKPSNARRPKKSSPARPSTATSSKRNNNKTPPSFSSSRRSDTPPSFSDEPPSFGTNSRYSPPRFSHNNKISPSHGYDKEESDNETSEEEDDSGPSMPMAPPRRVFKNY